MKERENNELFITAEAMGKTFVNRQDCFAVQTEAGQYYSVKDALTVHHIERHLKGEVTLGVYLLGQDTKAKYAVIDADDEENFERAMKARENLPFPSYMESSRRGGHLWFFFEEPIEGKTAKNFGLEIAKKFLVEAEVYPKQAESAGPGSCIRLPFGIHKKAGERYPFVGLGNWRQQFDALSNPVKIPISEVLKYQYREPERKTFKPLSGDLPLWEKVKRQITVAEMAEQYVDLNSSGVGKCPFHDDQNPSFSVNADENYWNCFSGCGGGSVIDFWMKLNDMDFRDAVTDLAERLGVK
jgi:hypothetical protein